MALPPNLNPTVPGAQGAGMFGSMAAGGFGNPSAGGTTMMSSPAQAGQMLPQGSNIGLGGVLPIGTAPSLSPPGMMPRTMPTPNAQGALQVASNSQIGAAQAAQQQALAESQIIPEVAMTGLAAYIARQWEMMNRHRLSLGIADRLLSALRAFNGQYDAQRLNEIKRFGGSDVYSRLTSSKSRGATSLLRDIYINQDRPWGFKPPDDVDVPLEVYNHIVEAVQGEVDNAMQMGEQAQMMGQPAPPPPTREQVRDRTKQLIEAARQAAKEQAANRSKIAEDKVETLLEEGSFYNALAEVLADCTIFPYCCLKGPTVRMQPTVQWFNGTPYVDSKPTLWFERVSPFDIWFSPGVANIADAQMIERKRYTRAALNDLLDLPGYDHAAVRACLNDYANGLTDIYDYTESSRSILESRENPQWNETGLIDCMEFHGNVQGQMLIDSGMDPKKIPDPMRDYMTTAWKIGRYIIKIQLNPSPRKRHPYFMSSFEKVPGTPVGNSLPDILADIQEMANVALRSMANNMAFASGPQVVVDDNRLAPSEDGESFYPWKRWHVRMDPFSNNSQTLAPISFTQPTSNAQELMMVYNFFLQLGDDASAVPRYITSGTGATGGASRTASGLAMLMGNAAKVLQTVAGNIDLDIMEPILTETKDLILLTDASDVLDGTEAIVPRGTEMAQQRETQRSRQLEFLQITMNPIDMSIMGRGGRAKVLKTVSQTLGMPGEEIVPDEQEIENQDEQAQQLAAMQATLGGGTPGGSPPGPQAPSPIGAAQANQPPRPGNAMGPRTNTVQPRIAGGVG